MTQEIIEMARDSGMELYGLGKDRARFVHHLVAFAKLVAEKALAEHAMREVQRLGQEIEPDDIASIIACRDMLDAQPVPPRTWVGLTDEDMYVVSEEESCSFIAGAKWSEAILKGKNT